MNAAYFIGSLIGISSVLFLIFAGLTVKIHLEKERREKCTKEKKRNKYTGTIKLCRRARKTIQYAVIFDMVIDIMCFIPGSTDDIDFNSIKDNSAEAAEIVSIDPKERLARNDADEKVRNIFKEHLSFSWSGEGDKRTKESYREKMDEILGGKEPVYNASEETMNEAEKQAYYSYCRQLNEIDERKVPQGATLEQVQKGEVSPLTLDVDTYKKEHWLWDKCYLLCPTAGNLQQMARSALDVQTTMIKYIDEYEDDWDEIIEYAFYGIQGYLSLLFYVSSGESKADCCYWIAKTFYDLAQKMPDKYREYVEHCYLMAYTFAEKGLNYQNIDNQRDDHIFDLKKIKHNADKALEAYEQSA